MKSITEHRQASTLNVKVRYPEGIMTRAEWLQLMKSQGYTVKEVQEPKVIYNRIKYNRMTGREQDEYERKCNEMKTGYRLCTSESSSYDITKTEFDYFQNL